MPIYVEAKGILVDGNPFADHSYLVYVPIGNENDYSAWKTIGAYPIGDGLDGFGSNTPLNGEFIDSPLTGTVNTPSKDEWTMAMFPAFDVEDVAISLSKPLEDITVDDMVAAGYGATGGFAANTRSRTLVYEGIDTDEEAVWKSMVETATNLDEEFTYKATDFFFFNEAVFGPTVNSNSFVSSIIRHEADDHPGRVMLAFKTPDNTPGDETWIGTKNGDILDATVDQPNGQEARDLFGGQGADMLVGDDRGGYLVAGDDTDRDTVQGGSGTDTLVGYYNQRDLSQSDILMGGGGSDTIYIIDPDLVRPGGIPDPEQTPDARAYDFTLDGGPSGSGGLIDGGEGYDTLDYQHITSAVHLRLDQTILRNVEQINLTETGDDVVSAVQIDGYDLMVIDGRGGTNQFSIAGSDNGVVITGDPGALSIVTHRLESNDGLNTLELLLNNFEDYILTDFDDEANFQLFDDMGTEITTGFRIAAFAGDGGDTLTGSGAHDDLSGGLGSDQISGGGGADYLYDNGAKAPYQDGESIDAYVNRVLAYDTDGNDIIDGGDGADVLVHSGGQDVFRGGAGHDTYITIDEVTGTYGGQDSLTIVLEEGGPDKPATFGNDFIAGDGRGVDLVQFAGLNRDDVEIFYDYEEVFIGSQVLAFDPISWWLSGFERQTVDHYVTNGALQVRVKDTGSSLTIENVTGYHTRGDNGFGLATFEASMSVPFSIQFDDGLLDWPSAVLDPTTNFYTFAHTDLGEDAFAANGALETERSALEVTLYGDADPGDLDDVLFGTTVSELIEAGAGDDIVFAGRGDDVIIGGTGADTLNGGSGIDAASFASAAASVSAYLDPERPSFQNPAGDALGDVYIDIENLAGSAFDDRLYGNDGANLIEGGAGNDTIFGLGGQDTLIGGVGDDLIRTGEYVNDDGVLFVSDVDMYGGAGNDTIRSSSGNDRIFGGDGDDLVELSFFVNIFSPGTPGNDTIDGGTGIDTVHFFHGPVVVDLVAGTGSYSGSNETVRLVSVEGIVGSREDDLIVGGAEDNVFEGNGGNDTLVGGAGNDELYADKYSFAGDVVMYGGSGIDTGHIVWASDSVATKIVDGGLQIINLSGFGTYTIYDDIEFVQFSDTLKTYQELAQGLITEFAVIDDYIRVDEGATVTLDLLANDLEFDGNPLSIESINGVSANPGAVIQLDSGATIIIEADGSLAFDQGGAYAWLDAGASEFVTIGYSATDVTDFAQKGVATLVIDGGGTDADQIHLDRNVYIAKTNPDAADALRIGNFDVAKTILIVDEKYIDPNDVPTGYSLQEIDGDMFITYGGDDAVILSDVALDTWQYAAANRTIGTSASDTIAGTNGDDVIQAGAGNDSVQGGDGDDVVVGQDGADRLWFTNGDNIAFGGSGDDSLRADGTGANLFYGGAGNDSLIGADGSDTFNGGSGADTLQGRDGDDQLFGGDGDDVFFGGDGIDFFDGGEGFDRLDLRNEHPESSSTGLIVDMRLGYFSWSDNSYGLERFENIEHVNGASGDDLIIGNDVGVRMDGIGGDDTLIGGAGDDTLTDGSDTNELRGGAGHDYMNSTASGNDTFEGGTGNDTIRGGNGSDVVKYRLGDGHDEVQVYQGALKYDLTAFASDDVVFSETPTGRLLITFADSGTLTAVDGGIGAVEFSGGVTLDWVGIAQKVASDSNTVGSSGADLLIGGAGDDTLVGGDGDDTLNGNDGNDIHIAGAGNDLVYGNYGFLDSYDGGTGYDTLDFTYSVENVVIDLIAETVVFPGGTIQTVTNFEAIITGSGNDSIVGNLADNLVDSGSGNDTIYGGDGNDTLNGGDGDDFHYGGAGDDLIYGNFGGDYFDGGIGNDTLDFSYSTDNVAINLGAETVSFSGGAVQQITGFENLTAGSGDNLITGSSSNNVIDGGDGNDTVRSGAGNDMIETGEGNDLIVIEIGDGSDTVADFDVAQDRISLGGGILYSTNLPQNLSIAQLGNDLFFEDTDVPGASLLLENVVLSDWLAGALNYNLVTGTAADDTLIGGNENDLLRGEAGHDFLDAGAGDDLLNGGDGNDTLDGSDGDDFIYGEAGNDLVIGGFGGDYYDGGTGTDTLDFRYSSDNVAINLGAETVTFSDSAVQQIIGFEVVWAGLGDNLINGSSNGDTIFGGAGDDTIYGEAGDDYIGGEAGNNHMFGGAGNDTIIATDGNDSSDGGAGDDLIYGTIGDDSFSGGDGFDTLDFSYTANHFSIDLSTGLAVFENGFTEYLTGIEAIIGGSGNNVLTGAADANVIDGATGNDTIAGLAGNDTLTGGSGLDVFVFADDTASADTVTDYSKTDDTLDITAWGATGLGDLAVTSVEQGTSGIFDVEVAFGGNTLHLADISAADLANIGGDDFIFT